MLHRTLSEKIRSWARQYPIITITGPRQSGKSTLSKALFPDLPYFNLEEPQLRRQALEDPKGFLGRAPGGAILDEIQRAPELPSYIQALVDAAEKPGMYILTGSSVFELMDRVSQSLAGRTAIARLLPFSYGELYADGPVPSLDELLYRGFFPRIHDKGLDPTEALSFYVSTYLDRDLRDFLAVKDLSRFETFLRLLAGRSGQLLNASSLGNDCGVSHNTILSWISVLEQSFLLHILRPWHGNIGKRLMKSPKPYFLDSGLLCYLLGIRGPSELAGHPLRGAVFETYVLGELLKAAYNRGSTPSIHFFRDHTGNEVDFVIEEGGRRSLIEVKSSATFHPDFKRSLDFVDSLLGGGSKKTIILGSADKPYAFKDAEVRGVTVTQ